MVAGTVNLYISIIVYDLQLIYFLVPYAYTCSTSIVATSNIRTIKYMCVYYYIILL